MFNIKKAENSITYKLDMADIIAKLHLAAAKFTKEASFNKICITANSGILNDDIKLPNPETPGSKLKFLLDNGPNFSVSIVAICEKLLNEYYLLSKPEYSAVATSISTYENDENKNKTLLDDMIKCLENDKQYVVPVTYKNNKEIFEKCFSEVKKIKEENEKNARNIISELFSAYFENFMGAEAATQASNPSNLVYLNEDNIQDVIKDFEQQYKESGLLNYSNKLKTDHEKLMKQLLAEKSAADNQQNNKQTTESIEKEIMLLLFEDTDTSEPNTPKSDTSKPNTSEPNTPKSDTSKPNTSEPNTPPTSEPNKNTNVTQQKTEQQPNIKIKTKFPEKIDKIYAFAIGYSINVKEE